MLLEHSDTSAGTFQKTSYLLPRRDFIVLPALAVFTVGLLFTLSEIVTRAIWSEHENDVCFVNDPVSGFRFEANCRSRNKNAEGQWTSNYYNECGFRSPASCGPKPPGSLRIAILGSSVAQGVFVPYEETFSGRVAAELSQICHRNVDIQNLGVPNASPIYVYRRLEKALALKPDVIVFVITPFDLEQHIDRNQFVHRNDSQAVAEAPAATIHLSPYKRLQNLLRNSRTTFVAQHFLLQNQETFIKLYLLYGDKADFLRQPLTPAWEQRFVDLDLIISDMSRKVRAAGASFILMPVPSRAEAAMLSYRRTPSNIDAPAFGHRIQQIAAQHSAGYVDLMSRFQKIPGSEKLFYVVDGHVTSAGHQVIAAGLLDKLLDGSVSSLSACSGQKTKG